MCRKTPNENVFLFGNGDSNWRQESQMQMSVFFVLSLFFFFLMSEREGEINIETFIEKHFLYVYFLWRSIA